MTSSKKTYICVISLFAFLTIGCIALVDTRRDMDVIPSDDRVFLDNIIGSLKAMTGTLEQMGDHSFFIRLGKLIDKHPSASHQVISTLVNSLDDRTLTKVTYLGKPLPLGVMCYKALQSICYYEATDVNGNITSWDGAVLPSATENDLKTAKRAWMIILKNRTYIML